MKRSDPPPSIPRRQNGAHVVVRFDRDLRFTYASSAIARSIGLSPAMVLNKRNTEIGIPSEISVKWDTALRQVFDSGRSVDLDYDFDSPESGMVHVHSTLYPDFAGEGFVEQVLAVSRETTASERVEEALRKNQGLLYEISQNIPSGSISVFDRELRYVFAQGPGLARVGLSSDQLVGRTLAEVFGEEATLFVLPLYRRALAGETVEFEMAYKDFSYSINAAPLKDDNNYIYGILAVARDITKRKRAEETVQRRDDLLQAIFNSLSPHMAVIDSKGTITYVSKSWERFARQNGAELSNVGIGANYLNVCRQALAKGCESAGGALLGIEAVREGKLPTFALEYPCHSTTEQRWFEMQVDSMPGAHGGVVITHTNITHRKVVEQEREHLFELERKARKEAEAANLLKDDFLATLSHELRTPLTAVLGWVRMLRGGSIDEKTSVRGLEVIERNAEAQLQLIEDLLDVSRVVTGKLRLDLRLIELGRVIEAAIDSVRPSAEAKDIELVVDLNDEALPISGDQERLQQVVWNLLSNAIKFTPRGGLVKISLRRIESIFEIKITDTGIGISRAFLPHVFERFRQADQSSTRTHTGLGLGLAVVRHLVEQHGGTVAVESEGENMGSTFTVKLPLSAALTASAGTVEARKSRGADTLSSSSILENVRVLLVDDQPDARELLGFIMTQAGAKVRTAASAAEGFDLLRAFMPNVVVTDIGMPEEDGYGLLQRTRALSLEQGGAIPFVALTAYAAIEDQIQTLMAGFQKHLTKPVEPAQLIETVASLAASRPSGR